MPLILLTKNIKLEMPQDREQTARFEQKSMYQFINAENVCDLDLGPMILVLKLDLHIILTYLQAKMRSIGQMV